MYRKFYGSYSGVSNPSLSLSFRGEGIVYSKIKLVVVIYLLCELITAEGSIYPSLFSHLFTVYI